MDSVDAARVEERAHGRLKRLALALNVYVAEGEVGQECGRDGELLQKGREEQGAVGADPYERAVEGVAAALPQRDAVEEGLDAGRRESTPFERGGEVA